jgi:hypothetical protein
MLCSWVFQQHNNPKHTYKLHRDWFITKKLWKKTFECYC